MNDYFQGWFGQWFGDWFGNQSAGRTPIVPSVGTGWRARLLGSATFQLPSLRFAGAGVSFNRARCAGSVPAVALTCDAEVSLEERDLEEMGGRLAMLS